MIARPDFIRRKFVLAGVFLALAMLAVGVLGQAGSEQLRMMRRVEPLPAAALRDAWRNYPTQPVERWRNGP